jgi:hypothetical protein
MHKNRVPLFDRLPEIYQIKDAEGRPPDQLRSYLSLVEAAFGAIHENIESLYEDLFIETCDDWVIPYIGDLLGVSHLAGDPWTLRADVADAIALRRRKGTLASIERLTYDLTKWGVHCVELRNNLVWNQHLNHQRPDSGGDPPYGQPTGDAEAAVTRFAPIRGGTITLRDPAMLSLLHPPPVQGRTLSTRGVGLRDPATLSAQSGPFDPFAHVADLKPPAFGSVRYNLPNLSIFLWRLRDYRVELSKPVWSGTVVQGGVRIVRFDVHPLGDPVRLFNTYQFDPDRDPPIVTGLDRTPGPIPTPRLTEGHEAGNPEAYVAVDTYASEDLQTDSLEITDPGLQFHLPISDFEGRVWPKTEDSWSIRGSNLCAWEVGLRRSVKSGEIIIDPVTGRVLFGVDTAAEATALRDGLLVTYTYGAVGPVGAHPKSRPPAPRQWEGLPVLPTRLNLHEDGLTLEEALNNIHQAAGPVVIEIDDSLVHELDINAVDGRIPEDGGMNLRLNHSLIIRAGDGQRPIIRLKRPLRFRPTDPKRAGGLTLRFEGIYLTRSRDDYPTDAPLIARAALNRIEFIECTLDPGGQRVLDGTYEGRRAAIHTSLRLKEPYGFDLQTDVIDFDQTPEVVLRRTIAGPLRIDRGYFLTLEDSIVDPGEAENGNGNMRYRRRKGRDTWHWCRNCSNWPTRNFNERQIKPTSGELCNQCQAKTAKGNCLESEAVAITNASAPNLEWGPPTQVNGLTLLGRMRVESINGRGGIFVSTLKVLNHQLGCLRHSYISGKGDVVPQNIGCVNGAEAKLHFVSEVFGNPAYGQLAFASDRRIREQGPQRTELPIPISEWLNSQESSYSVTFEGERVFKLGDQMGAFGFLLEAHRWRNIQIRFREFMPVGIRPLLVPVT